MSYVSFVSSHPFSSPGIYPDVTDMKDWFTRSEISPKRARLFELLRSLTTEQGGPIQDFPNIALK